MSTDNRQQIKIQKALKQVGLTDNEVLVYLALLKTGTAKAALIAINTDLNRTTTYDILRHLVHKGVVTKFTKNKTAFYTIPNPHSLITHLEHEKIKLANEIDQKKEQITSLLPELISLAHTENTKPKIVFYEGARGIREAYEDTLTATPPIFAYADISSIHEELGDYFPNYLSRRVKQKIHARAIVPDTSAWRELAQHNRADLREVKFLPQGTNYTPEINIYDNKMLIVLWREKIAVIIESKELANLQRIISEQLWSRLPGV